MIRTVPILLSISLVGAAADREVPQGIWVRPGYRLSVAENTIKLPRFMKVGPEGTLYVSVPTDGVIYALRDRNRDGYFETKTTFVKAGPSVHGMYWHDGWLWWTQPGEIARSRDTDGDGKADETVRVLVVPPLPQGGGHWWRSILVHKGRIYTEIGDPSNITDVDKSSGEAQTGKSLVLHARGEG